MRILIINDSTAHHVVLVNWIHDLIKMGHEVKLATPNKDFNYLFSFSHFKINKWRKLWNQIVDIKNIINLKNEVNQYAPDLIWFHNINATWSWSCLLVQTKSNVPKIITLHDFTCIYPTKITEEMLDSDLKFMYFKFGLLKGSIYKLRSLLIRYFLSKVKVVSIGDLQNKILITNNIKVVKRIENYVMECRCNLNTNLQKENVILFAGRQILKGFDVVVESVSKSDNWVLLIAGSNDLLSYAKHKLPSTKYRYLGQLSNLDLICYIHSVKFVAVLSQYYDNFPTIGIEAMVHGSLPITTNLTGISSICKNISSKLIFNSGDIPDLEQLNLEFYSKNYDIKLSNSDFTNQKIFFNEFFSLLA